MKKIILTGTMLMLIAFTNVAGAANWPESINGRWLHGGGQTTSNPHTGEVYYIPAHVYEVQLAGDQLTLKIVELGLYNLQHEEKRTPQNFLYFQGSLEGNRAQGRYQSPAYDPMTGRNFRSTESYDKTETIVLSGDGNTLYWGNMEFRRE